MTLECQRDKFYLPEQVSYLNCAFMAPNLKSVEEAGIRGIRMKNFPYLMTKEDFFEPVDELKKLFAKLINLDEFERVALIPSVSYGIASVARNVKPKPYGNIVVAAEQFPSNYYAWKRLADTYDLQMRIIRPPESNQRGKVWNEMILESIDDQTVLVAIANAHWADGTKFNMLSIRERTIQHTALLVIDGTQSIGAMPFDVSHVKPDALICAGYKWILGPYSLGLAYLSERFDNGIPIEENWITRWGSDNFQGLVNYEDRYLPKAARYSVGESSNFILVPMLSEAIRQLIEWQPERIQLYCKQLIDSPLQELHEMGAYIESEEFRGNHLFGIRTRDRFDLSKLTDAFSREQVFVSLRGDFVRVSVNVFNNQQDLAKLVQCFREARL